MMEVLPPQLRIGLTQEAPDRDTEYAEARHT